MLITTPTVAENHYLCPKEARCNLFVVGPATGTVEALVRTTGPGYLNWVYLSTGSVDAYVAIKDTGVLAAMGNPNGPFEVYHVNGGGIGTWSYVRFEPPMRFANGLAVTKSVATTKVTFCTRLYGTQVP